MSFAYQTFLPAALFQEVNRLKSYQPQLIRQELAQRQPARPLPPRFVLAAADHQARMINAYHGNPLGLANRQEYLARLIRILYSSVHGLEAAPDVLEDLLLLNYLARQQGLPEFLADKYLIGTVNRGGLLGSCWELDDFCSCYSPAQAKALGLDAVKFMLRLDPADPLSRPTLEYCAQTVAQACELGLPIFIEVLFLQTTAGGRKIAQDVESLVKSIGVAAALGGSSASKWLEIPVSDDYPTLARSTTCSLLVVPNEQAEEAQAVIREYSAQLDAAPQVRGILLGRNVMYHQEDPLPLAEAICQLWRAEAPRPSVAEAYQAALAADAPTSLLNADPA